MSATAVYQVAMGTAEAYDYTHGALTASGAVLGAQSAPARMDFLIRRKDPDTGAIDLEMPGRVFVTTSGDGRSTVTIAIEPATNLFAYALGLGLVAVVFGSWFVGSTALWFLIVLTGEAWIFWSVFNKWPTAVLDAIREKMLASPAVDGGAPVVQPAAPVFSTQPSAPPPASTADIADQIRHLAALRDEGHLTQDEFDAKKAELLQRI
jgi:Short C-terminal domain